MYRKTKMPGFQKEKILQNIGLRFNFNQNHLKSAQINFKSCFSLDDWFIDSLRKKESNNIDTYLNIHTGYYIQYKIK